MRDRRERAEREFRRMISENKNESGTCGVAVRQYNLRSKAVDDF